jgi:hypothetical protein
VTKCSVREMADAALEPRPLPARPRIRLTARALTWKYGSAQKGRASEMIKILAVLPGTDGTRYAAAPVGAQAAAAFKAPALPLPVRALDGETHS